MPNPLTSPLAGPAPQEIFLLKAPLETVIAQVRFSTVLRLRNESEVVEFQERMRGDYPYFVPEVGQELFIEVTPTGPQARQNSTNVWRFLSADQKWRVTLGTEAISLESKAYTTRNDFVRRIAAVVERLQSVYAPEIITRTGLRYLSRIRAPEFERTSELLAAPFRGVLGTAMEASVEQTMSEALVRTDEGKLTLRWGVLPQGATIDPGLLEPLAEPSAVLDIDSFCPEQRLFRDTNVIEHFDGLAARAYAVFRSIVTDEFLRTYGGQV